MQEVVRTRRSANALMIPPKMPAVWQNSPFSDTKGTYLRLRGRPRMWEVFSVQNGDLLVLKRGSGGFCVRENDGEHKKHHAKVKKQGILTQQPTGLLASMASTRGGGRRRRKWCCCGARRVGNGRRQKIPLSGCFVEGGGGSSLVCELSEQCPPAE